MAGEQDDNQQALDILTNITGKGDVGANVSDVNAYTPQGLSPQQQQNFNKQYAPQSKKALDPTDYYPDLHHNINVGNYSGSEIGSASLFAPGGGLVPLGMMDARDAAVQHAAMKKAKDIEDFNKQHKSPTTKHTAVQKELTEDYYNGLQQWQQNALKKAGGNQALANQMLKQDPKFNQWNQSRQDRAKMQDQGIEVAAKLDALEKDPNMVLSPETREAKRKFMSGEYASGDHFSTEGTQFTKNFIAMKGMADMDVKTNEVLSKAMPDIQQLTPDKMKELGIDPFTTRGKNEIAKFIEKESYSDERVKDMAHSLFMGEYQGTGATEEQVYNSLKSKVGEKIKQQVVHYDKYHKPDASGKDEDYSNVRPVSETSFNVGAKNGLGGKGITEIYSDKSFKTTASDEQKKISVPISKHTVDTQGKGLNLKAGNVDGTVSQVFQGYYDKQHKRWLNPQEVKDLKDGKVTVSHDIVARPAVMFNITPDKGEKGAGNSLILDVNEIKGKFPKKGKEKKSFDDIITDLEQSTESENATRKGTGWPVKQGNSTPGKNPGVNAAGIKAAKKDPLGIF